VLRRLFDAALRGLNLRAPLTLAISQQDIALSIHDKNSMLASASEQRAEPSFIADALASNQNIFKNQSVNIVLSNVLVRYIVLPWQDKVIKRTDWQAIARNAFSANFGAVADTWRVQVYLSAIGNNVLVAAIDETLCAQLETSAQQIGFSILSLQPLLTSILGQNPHECMLVAEPQRLTLGIRQDGNWQQVMVDSPPAGQEFAHAEQLIARSFMHFNPHAPAQKIPTYVSAALCETWQQQQTAQAQNTSRMQLIKLANRTGNHAQWLAKISAENHHTDLNFVQRSNSTIGLAGACLLACSAACAILFWQQYQQNKQQITQSQQIVSKGLPTKPSAKIDSAVTEKKSLAVQAQKALNLAWMPMLNAFETVKKNNADIKVVQLSPNKNRAEIKLKGETNDFGNLPKFLDDLRANAAFSDAVLTSHHLELEADKPKAPPIVVFEINVGWQL
jgi:GspL periplasmic domain